MIPNCDWKTLETETKACDWKSMLIEKQCWLKNNSDVLKCWLNLMQTINSVDWKTVDFVDWNSCWVKCNRDAKKCWLKTVEMLYYVDAVHTAHWEIKAYTHSHTLPPVQAALLPHMQPPL